MRFLIKGGTDGMFETVHGVLESILGDEACKDSEPLDFAVEGVVGLWHEVVHPCEGEVEAEEDESLGLG